MILQVGNINIFDHKSIIKPKNVDICDMLILMVDSDTQICTLFALYFIDKPAFKIILGNISELTEKKINNCLFENFKFISRFPTIWIYNKIEHLSFDELMDLFYKENNNDIQIMLRKNKIEKIKRKININRI